MFIMRPIIGCADRARTAPVSVTHHAYEGKNNNFKKNIINNGTNNIQTAYLGDTM